MYRTKVVTLVLAALVLVAVGHHQLLQMSTQALNTPLVPYAMAFTPSATPTPTPTPRPTPTPTPTPRPTPTPTPSPAPIGESCTPGFYKNHTGFINGGSCVSGVTKDTLVSTIFGSVGSSCVFNLTLLQALSAPPGASGPCPGNQAQLNLMRQAITAWLNATTSSPSACVAAADIVTLTDDAIVSGPSAEGALQNIFETTINNDKIGRCAGS